MKTRILLAEDNPTDIDLCLEYLESYKDEFAITVVGKVTEILEISADNTDMILLDLNLLDSMGLETFEKVFPYFRQVPIVILTGNTDLDVAKEAVNLGAQDFLSKNDINEYVLIRSIYFALERANHKQIEQKYEVLKQRTKRMNSISKLTAGFANSFHNNITVILGYIELLQESIDSETETKYLDQIQQASEFSLKLIDQLIAFSNTDIQNMNTIDPNELINENIDALRIKTEGHLESSFSSVGKINCNEKQIEQMLVIHVDHMYQNGDKSTVFIKTENTGKDELREELGMRKGASTICIKVYINQEVEMADSTFDPFDDHNKMISQRGLDLAIAYTIAQTNNAEITFTGDNEISGFNCYFPQI